MAAHPDRFRRRDVLLARRPARRASRSQHPVLEIAASFGSYDRALESEYSARGSATARLRDHRHPAANYAAAEHRSPLDKRRWCPDAVDKLAVVPDAIRAPLRSGRARALARATLRMAAAGLRLGAARDVS